MDDITTWLSSVDELEPPGDLWTEAIERVAAPGSPPLKSLELRRDRRSEMPTGWRKAAVVLTSFAVFAAAVGFAWNIVRRVAPDPADPTPSTVAADPFADLAPGWTELAGPPEARCCAATAWTGSELLIWGGHVGQTDQSQSTGFTYDARTGAWAEMPEASLGPRTQPAGVWTGSELIVWGGADFTTRYPYESYNDGAAYDPATHTWRALPPAPIDARQPFAVWTGREMIVWGSQSREQRRVDGAAYDPALDAWRRIADAPAELTDAAANWTGEEMIVFGAALHGGNFAETDTAIAIAYDPAADSWRRLPDSEIDTNASDAVWIGERLLVWDYNLESQVYDPVTDSWVAAGSVPTDECEDVPSTVVAGAAYGRLCGDLVTFDGQRGTWHPIGQPMTPFSPDELYAAGDTLLAVGVADPYDGGEDWRMFAYRQAATGELLPEQQVQPFPLPTYVYSGGETTLGLVFPDGSQADIAYPQSLDLASWGIDSVQPDLALQSRGTNRSLFLHGLPGVEVPYLAGAEPVAELEAGDGTIVQVWNADPERSQFLFSGDGLWLNYRTPRWSVLVGAPDLATARILVDSIRVTEEGQFPVISAQGPVDLPSSYGDGGGPQLTLGDSEPHPSMQRLGPDDLIVELSPDGCERPVELPEQGFAKVCLGDGEVAMYIYADPEFIRAIVDGFRLEYFQPAQR